MLAVAICGLSCLPLAAQDNVQHIPRQTAPTTGAIEGIFQNEQRLGLGNVEVALTSQATNQTQTLHTSGDGIIRVLNVPPGRYSLRATLEGFQPFESGNVVVRAGELVDLSVTLMATGTPSSIHPPIPPAEPQPSYRTLPETPPQGPGTVIYPAPGEPVTAVVNRWNLDWPNYHRYGPKDEAPYIKGNWWDPFNRNKLKGDYPIFGQTFLNLNFVSDTFNEARQLPLPSGQDSTRPQSSDFFGRFGQYALSQDFIFEVTLFHGDTSFKPVDWQIRFTPDVNVNYAYAQENGVLNVNPALGNTRLDSHVGLQEGFVEAKIADLSHNYDFVSVRAGIQTFNSDFRGFIFFDQEPGVRLFGNLDANRFQYNAAYFAMLEKDTNSGLNTFDYRHQQVFIANIYRQDFLFPGYTIQASYHFNKDDPSVQYDTDGFLARPAPVGAVYSNGMLQTDAIRAHYIGVTGDGHIGRINVNHAFYEVLGHDKFNDIAQALRSLEDWRKVNAQMAALELSMDRDWIRYRVSAFYSSGAKNPASTTERGFDSIFDNPDFAGGFFSFWVREGVHLLGTGLGLMEGNTLIPDLRTSKIEGQSNFVNPGIFIYNAASDIKLTPKLKMVLNANFIRFDYTAPIEFLLQQSGIPKSVGADTGIGLSYRPALTENMTINGVWNAFVPWAGFSDILTGKTLYSVAANVRFRF